MRKDLSKTLETLKTVVRRAPKMQVKVESVPLPAPKPRGYSPPTKADDASPRAAHLASLDPEPEPAPDGTVAVGAVSATDTGAPVTGSQEETVAPFSSVLRENREKDKHANGESNVYSYQARTTVEELPEEAEAETPPPTPSPAPAAPVDAAAAAAAAAASGPALPIASSSTASQEDSLSTETRTASVCTGIDGEAATAEAAVSVAEIASETTPARVDAARPREAVATVAAAAAAVGADPGRSAATSAAESDRGGGVGPKRANNTGGAGGGAGDDNNNTVSVRVPREARGGEAASPLPPDGRTQAEEDQAAPSLPVRRPPSPDARSSPGATSTQTAPQQLPTTGYQFELMWRSTDGTPEDRLELLRAVPPSSVAKFFRRTPIEVDLLGGVLRGLGEAFLPRKPATALRWLKSLSRACRFGMTVALLGEADGRAAAREVLTRLEAAPPAKVDPQDVAVLREQFLV